MKIFGKIGSWVKNPQLWKTFSNLKIASQMHTKEDSNEKSSKTKCFENKCDSPNCPGCGE